MEFDEKGLIEQCRNGDVAAFENLVLLYEKKVFNVAYRMLGNKDDASEIAQEVFVKVFVSINQFKGKSSFSTWVYRITVNMCLDEIRKRKKVSLIYINEGISLDDGEVEMQIATDAPGPDEMAELSELQRTVTKAILLLSEEQRTVIILRDIQGLSYKEIAEIIKCPSGTVKSRVNRARAALKHILEELKEPFSAQYVKDI